MKMDTELVSGTSIDFPAQSRRVETPDVINRSFIFNE